MGTKPYIMNQPLVPDAAAFSADLAELFASSRLTNFGAVHQRFEAALMDHLGVAHVLPVANATFGLINALMALEIQGEVITTPFTFPATYHALFNLADVTPVFVDVSRDNFGLDPARVRAAITPQTRAIMPVHAYGFPAAVEELEAIAREHGLYLIYDAAPCFGVKFKGESLLNFGHASVLSFHATKVFNTAEGGAIVCRDQEIYDRCWLYSNFGIKGEESVFLPGLNTKMDELRCLLGLHNLKRVAWAVAERKRVVGRYLDFFRELGRDDVAVPADLFARPDFELNYSYFPIVITPSPALNRDLLAARLREREVYARKYYFPTVLDLPLYAQYPAVYHDLPVARFFAQNALCLPVNPFFSDDDCRQILAALADSIR